jgi:type IV secretion system protein VirD4
MKRKTKKRVLGIVKLTPYALFAWAGNRGSFAFRTTPGDMTAKVNGFLEKWINALTVDFLPSFNMWDLSIGLLLGVGIWYVIWDKKKNAKKLRAGKEHGSVGWGKEKDIEPYIDFENFDNNVLFTQTERLTLGSGKGANDRNKNTLVIGGSGTGKTLFVVKPNLMQTHSSYCTTDPPVFVNTFLAFFSTFYEKFFLGEISSKFSSILSTLIVGIRSIFPSKSQS